MNKHKSKPPKNEPADGFKGWLIVMVCVFCAYLTIESYNRYGIVRGPIEINDIILETFSQHQWLFFSTFLCYFLQITLAFILEKCLSVGLLSEKIGMIYHALNAFLLPTAYTVLARITDANPAISRVVSTCNLFVMCKAWSYAYVNSTYRKSFQQQIIANNKKHYDTKYVLKYPSNVTIRNIITYMVFTPPIQYEVHYTRRTNPDWRTFGKLCLQLVLVYYVALLLAFQFVIPEMFILRTRGWEITNIIKFSLRIALPVNLIWFIFGYIHTYRTYLPAYAAITGFKNVLFYKDWWDAEDLNMFWRKWNWPVHECLKYNVVIPLLQNGYSKTTATLIAFGLAGILHEYMNSLPYGMYSGAALLFTFAEVPAGSISEYVARKLGSRFGNLLVWLFLLIIHCGAAVVYSFALPHFAADFPFQRYY